MPNGTQKHTESSMASTSHVLGRAAPGAAGASGASAAGRFSAVSFLERGSSMSFFRRPGGAVLWGQRYGNRRGSRPVRAAFFFFYRNMPENVRLLPLGKQLFVDLALPLAGKSPCAFREKRCMFSGKVQALFASSPAASRSPLQHGAEEGLRRGSF